MDSNSKYLLSFKEFPELEWFLRVHLWTSHLAASNPSYSYSAFLSLHFPPSTALRSFLSLYNLDFGSFIHLFQFQEHPVYQFWLSYPHVSGPDNLFQSFRLIFLFI